MCSWKYTIKWYNDYDGEWVTENGVTIAPSLTAANNNINEIYGDCEIEVYTLTCWDNSCCITLSEIKEMFKHEFDNAKG